MRAVLLAVSACLTAGAAVAQTDTAKPPTPVGANPGPVLDRRGDASDVGRAGLSDPARNAAATRPNGQVAPPSAISSGVQVIAPEKK